MTEETTRDESPVEAQRKLTGDRLRQVARYLDVFDRIVTEIYRPVAESTFQPPPGDTWEDWEVSVEVLPGVTPELARMVVEEASGRDVQNDLLRWADEIDAAAVRESFNQVVITAKADDPSIEVIAEKVDGAMVIRSIKNAHIEGGAGIPYVNPVDAIPKRGSTGLLRWIVKRFDR